MTDEELIRRGDVRKAILEYLEETGSELERWDIDQIVSGIAAEDRIEELVKEKTALNHLCNAIFNSHIKEITAAEAKLTECEARLGKAVEALREIETDCDADYPPSHGAIKHAIRAVLAELEGEG